MTDITTLAMTANPEERQIAAKLLHLRTLFGISREQLAAMLDIHAIELMQYEKAIVPISASLLLLASIALGVEYDYFYQESYTPSPLSHHDKDQISFAAHLV